MPNKQAIRDELEATRASYHSLLASLSDDDWRRRSGNAELTVKELMWHTAWALGWMARSIDGIRQGKSLRAPGFLLDPGRKLAMRWLARNATPDAAARKYDEGHQALIERLETVPDADWALSATRFGEVRTVEFYFRHAKEHFDEHARDVRAVLKQSVEAK